MIYKLVCAGNNCFNSLYKYDSEEIIVAIDGGYKVLEENNIRVDYFFGDFDSLDNTNILSKEIKKYNSIKDKSDFELAIDYLINDLKISKLDEVLVYNATGGRLDHYYSILNILKKYQDYQIKIIDNNNCIYVSEFEMQFERKYYKYISFYSIENGTIISLSGFKYNINNYLLNDKDNLCLSNEIINKAQLKTNKKVLIIESK